MCGKNHFFFEEPRIFYMHVMGHGKPADLARMAKPALDLIGKAPRHDSSPTESARSDVRGGKLDTAKLAQIVGHDGEQNGKYTRSQSVANVDQAVERPVAGGTKLLLPLRNQFRGIVSARIEYTTAPQRQDRWVQCRQIQNPAPKSSTPHPSRVAALRHGTIAP